MKASLLLLLIFISFRGYSQPVIHSFSPVSGAIGTTVRISGSNFSTIPSSNTVFFGGVRANVTATTASSITVTVPFGSMYEPISVTTNGLTAYSSQPFVTTFTGATQLSSSSFSPKVDYGTGYWSDRVLLADLDGDGKADMINIHSSGKMSFHKNTSAASSVTFAPQQIFNTSNYPLDAAIGDIDGDGKLDVVVVCPDSINVFKNNTTNGTVSFVRTDIAGTADAASIVLTDFNKDGRPDIATVGSNSSFIAVYKNTTAGSTISFGSRQSFATAGSAFSFTAGDLDGDNKPDLAIAGYNSSTLTVLLNTSTLSTISFIPAITQSNQQGIRHVAIADFTGDGKNDMAIANINSSKLHLYRNESTIGAIGFAPSTDLTVAHEPNYLAAADMNGDGKPDIITANVNASSVSIYVNNSTSTAMSFATGVAFACIDGESPYAVAIADLTVDSKPDIVVSNYQSARLSVFRNRMNEAFNCTGNLSTTVSLIDEPCGIYGSGKATLTTSGGNGIVQYSLDGRNYKNGNSFDLAAGSYRIIAKDEGGCTDTVEFSIKKTPSPMVISLSDTIVSCGSTSVSVSVSVVNGIAPYVYSLNNGAYSSSNLFSNLIPATYILSVKDSIDCIKEITFTIKQGGPPQLAVTNPEAVCKGATADLTTSSITAGSDAGLTYTYWADKAATQTLSNPSAVGVTGTYYIKGTAPGGCSIIKPVIVSVLDFPEPPAVSADGSVQICQGGSVTLSSSAATNYQWYKNNSIIAGATKKTYVATQEGDYEVRTSNACSSSHSNVISVGVSPVPSITAAGPVVFCQGLSVVLRSSAASGNQWYKNNIAIADSTHQTLTVTESGSYSVKVTTGSCTTEAAGAVSVTVNPIPAAPVISQSGNNVLSSALSGNHWYKDGSIIGGVNGQVYTATAVGVYTANVTINGCTSAFSNAITIASLSTSSSLDSNIKWGPNPTQSFLEIRYTGTSPSYIVNILDLKGNVLIRVEAFIKTCQLDMRRLSSGYYILQIITPDTGERLQKLILKQ